MFHPTATAPARATLGSSRQYKFLGKDETTHNFVDNIRPLVSLLLEARLVAVGGSELAWMLYGNASGRPLGTGLPNATRLGVITTLAASRAHISLGILPGPLPQAEILWTLGSARYAGW